MTKIRVHEYAKKVNRSTKEVIEELGKFNVEVANHMSTIDTEAISKLDKSFASNKGAQVAPKANTGKSAPKSTRPAQSQPKPSCTMLNQLQLDSVLHSQRKALRNVQLKQREGAPTNSKVAQQHVHKAEARIVAVVVHQHEALTKVEEDTVRLQ